MFRVPSDAAVPTFDQTFKVGFFRWLSSSATDRQEWATRRNIAAKLAGANRVARGEQSLAAHHERYVDRRAELEARAAQIRAEISAQVRSRPGRGR